MPSAWLRIGTRGSPLALAQAHQVKNLLIRAGALDVEQIAIVVIRTTGDMIQDRPLSEAGGKGLFTKELDLAQIRGDIHIAVHSSKDLPTLLPPELEIAGYLPREDVRDALISAKAKSIAGLPRGAIVGTASLRRAAMVRRLRPDVTTTLLRGNVETRLRKAEAGEIDATLLAIAGLKRLGLADRATAVLEPDDFLPAVGQGAIAITARVGDVQTAEWLAPILDAPTGVALAAERAFLRVLDGSCRTPIAGLARVSGDQVRLRGMILRKDGSEAFEVEDAGPAAEAPAIGARAGAALLARAPADILAE
jgi:hydroxymethylbilane synthase